jgi:biotin carboxyl carrier protein
MARYAVLVGEREYSVEVGESQLFVDGQPVSFELTSLNGNGLHLLQRDRQNKELYFKRMPDDAYEVTVDGDRIVAHVDPAHRCGRRQRAQTDAGEIRAPMPGLVIDLPVGVGDIVEAQQVLAVQESMKMQMQLRAPFAGTVERIAVKTGDQVEKGALLVHISENQACSEA